MDTITKSLIWAGAIIIFALIAAFGGIESDTAQTMLIILPIVAWASIGQRGCVPCRNPFRGDRA